MKCNERLFSNYWRVTSIQLDKQQYQMALCRNAKHLKMPLRTKNRLSYHSTWNGIFTATSQCLCSLLLCSIIQEGCTNTGWLVPFIKQHNGQNKYMTLPQICAKTHSFFM
jgi:hypothetical protein